METPDLLVELPAIFDAAAVRDVHTALRQALSSAARVRIDGTKVESIDTAAGQLLASFALTGHALQLTASKALKDFLKVTAIDVVLPPEH